MVFENDVFVNYGALGSGAGAGRGVVGARGASGAAALHRRGALRGRRQRPERAQLHR